MKNHFRTVTLLCFAEMLLKCNCKEEKKSSTCTYVLFLTYFYALTNSEKHCFLQFKQYLLMNNWRLPNGETMLFFFRSIPTLYGDGKLSIEFRSGKDLNWPAIISDGKKIPGLLFHHWCQWIVRTRSRLSDRTVCQPHFSATGLSQRHATLWI